MRSRDLYLHVRKFEAKSELNLTALALLMAEQRFRGPFFRAAEIFIVAARVLPRRRLDRVTLGISQVQLHYWREFFPYSDISILFKTLSIINNYKMCNAYLSKKTYQNERELLDFYNGRPSRIYVEEFRKNLREMQKLHTQYS